MVAITRRGFLKGAGSAALGLSLASLALACRHTTGDVATAAADTAGAAATAGATLAPYGDWRDLYRQKWSWDRIVKGAHHVVNCVSSCPFNLYVKDGIVVREEQNTIMEALNPALPDFNPRGCQKGACFSDLMYSPQRIKYPVKRVGERGGGKWKRITWDEAYGEIVDKMVKTSVEDGPEAIIYDSGTANADYGAPTSGEIRFFDLLGATQLDGWAAVGDMPLGAIMTWGLFNFDSTSDDYFHSDLIFLWLGNPSYTRIPDAHFMWGARYNGTKVISVAPDYNASTMHVDEWVNLRVGTDAALALGMAHVIVKEGLYKADFVKEQTDLPLLVRDDTRLFLRQCDVEEGGKDNIFYVWDHRKGGIAEAPGSEGLGRSSTLALGELDPALEGSFEAKLVGGKTVSVRPVFVLLSERLAQYTPEVAGKIAGVAPERIRSLGREFAKAKAVSVFGSWGMMKHHHSDLFQRGIILLLAMTGNVGRRGTGIHIGAWYMLSSIEPMISGLEPKWWQKALMKVFQPTVREMLGYLRHYEAKMLTTPALLFLYEHAGLKDIVTRPGYHDANPGKPLAEAIAEAQAGKWLPTCLSEGKTPKILIHTRVNPLRRWPAPQVAEATLWPKLELIVGVNIKMSVTALKSDIVLPAAGYYERRGIKYAQSYVPYYAVGEKAVEPLGESKTEWEIFGVMAQQVQQRFKSQKLAPVQDVRGDKRDLGAIFDQWSQNGEFDPLDDLHFYERATSESSGDGPHHVERSLRARGGEDPKHRPVPHPHQHLHRLGRHGLRLLLPVVRREERAMADADRTPAVLHRPPVVLGCRRRAPDPQRAAESRRRLPAASDRRSHALVDSLDLARRAADAAAPARRAGRVHERPRREATRHRRQRPHPHVQRRRHLRAARQDLAVGTARTGHRLPRLGRLSVQELAEQPRGRAVGVEGAAHGQVRPAAHELPLRRASPQSTRHDRRRRARGVRSRR